MKERLKSIINLPFLICLVLVLLNDLYLKAEYHNWLTGKLSDFCGLFVFASFWAAFFPKKKQAVYFSTALLFVVWKSSYSQPFIDAFSYCLYPIYRVVDITDLMALLILPVVYHFNVKTLSKLRLNPILLGILTVFSFCATSIHEPTQRFDQPQYLLFKNGINKIENSDYPSNYEVHEIDSLIIVSIKEIRLSKNPALYDEYQKTQVLENLDLRFLRLMASDRRLKGDIFDYEELRDSLTIYKPTSIILKLDGINDYLNFVETRLNGSFKRYKNNELIIDGNYKSGIEDSVWTFYNNQNQIISKKYFDNGELVKIQHFDSSKVQSETFFDTRAQTVRDKYFLVSFIFILIISLSVKLYHSFKKSTGTGVVKISNFSFIIMSLVLPVVILAIAKGTSSLIPDSYSSLFIVTFVEVILVYLILLPILIIVFFVIRLRSKFDLIYYILLFALAIILIEEWLYLKELII